MITIPVDDGLDDGESPPVNNSGEITQITPASACMSGTYIVIYSAKRAAASDTQTTKNLQTYTETKFKTHTDVNKDTLVLSKTDVLPSNFKVYQMVNFNATQNAAGTIASAGGVDITERYEIDTGQRDLYYDKGRLRLKEPYKTNSIYPIGQLLIIYYYFQYY